MENTYAINIDPYHYALLDNNLILNIFNKRAKGATSNKRK